ncbi:MAG: L-arabinitol 4-dehydrogenase [Vezdaea aestivalis]|nr:MAG: L-arabinitol 4-dehydrogenase [Vezdaea aestivalis]
MVVKSDHILGHESSGIVTAVHPSVKDLQAGDRVAIEPSLPCGSCPPRLSGRYDGCQNDRFLSTPPAPGLLRRHIVYPAKWVHCINSLSFQAGALLEPLSVALAAIQRANVRIGDPVLVCGASPIGLITLLCCKAAGAVPLVITDVNPGRLKFAKGLAPAAETHLVAAGETPEEFADSIRTKMDGDEPAVAMECTGVESSLAAAVQAVVFGGLVFCIEVGKDHIRVPFMRLSTREIDLRFQYRYANTWPRAIRLLKNGVVNLDSLVTHTFTSENATKAFEIAADPQQGAIKVMIKDDEHTDGSGYP